MSLWQINIEIQSLSLRVLFIMIANYHIEKEASGLNIYRLPWQDFNPVLLGQAQLYVLASEYGVR